MEAAGLNPLLSEAGFSTDNAVCAVSEVPFGLNPLLSEAGFSTSAADYVCDRRL